MKIRDVILPFVSELPTYPVVSGSEIDFSIEEAKQTIYNDGAGKTLRVNSWVYAAQNCHNPVINVNRDEALQLNWTNHCKKQCPVMEVKVPFTEAQNALVPQNTLGQSGAEPEMRVDAVFSTHIHGARTNPASDGWPETLISRKQTKHDFHDNAERAKMHWYHDHAMHTTRLNVMAGLAAPYIIRDDVEGTIGLPKLAERELILVIQDRNLDVDIEQLQASGDHVVNWLHKTETVDGPLEFYGPLTLVNGVIWPRKEVGADWYRLRILNGANARVLALKFYSCTGNDIDYSAQATLPVYKIGTDGGLLPAPQEWSQFTDTNALVLMPAERIDLLIDFSALAGSQIAMVNAATSPFSGSHSIRSDVDVEPLSPDTDIDRTPYPEIMRFDIEGSCHKGGSSLEEILEKLTGTVAKHYHYKLPDPVNDQSPRVIILVEKDPAVAGQAGAMLTTMEMVQKDMLPDLDPALAYQCFASQPTIKLSGTQGYYHAVAERFQDPVNFQVTLGDTERWRFINLSPDSHPMHIHLVQFKVDRIIQINSAEGVDENGDPLLIDLRQPGENASDILNPSFAKNFMVNVDVGQDLPVAETGFKDTVRVDPGTIVEVVAQFKGFLGRYLYHCHLLEHEDHDMMRQFVVTRPDMRHHAMHVPGSIGKIPPLGIA